MINKERFEELNNEYNNMLRINKVSILKAFRIVLIIYVAVMALLYLFINVNQLFLIIGISTGAIIVIIFLISYNYISEKPLFTFIIDNIIKDMDSSLSNRPYPKDLRHINVEGGLFPSGCSITVKGVITDKDNNTIQLNTRLYTSDGKTTYQFFYGNYLTIDCGIEHTFQIRSHNKPHLKGIKFRRIEIENNLSVFVEEQDVSDYFYEPYLNKIKELRDSLNAKKIYLSVVNNQLHFAYETDNLIKKPKILTYETVTEIEEKLRQLITIPNEFKKISMENK